MSKNKHLLYSYVNKIIRIIIVINENNSTVLNSDFLQSVFYSGLNYCALSET